MLIHKKLPYESMAKKEAGMSFYFVNFNKILVDNILFVFYFYFNYFTETIWNFDYWLEFPLFIEFGIVFTIYSSFAGFISD